MSKVLYLESIAGVAGDMFSSAFVDAGIVLPEELETLPALLGLSGVRVEIKAQSRANLACTGLNVNWTIEDWKQKFDHDHKTFEHDTADNGAEHQATSRDRHHAQHHYDHRTNVLVADQTRLHWHTHYMDIVDVISTSNLSEPVRARAIAIFKLLADAESRAHGIKIEQVAFHEIGTVDSILDVVMAAYCIEKLQPDVIFASPLRPGRGVVSMQHGTLPIPPPASAQLLTGLETAATPEEIRRENVELSTPTGIAIIKSLNPAFVNELPPGIVRHQGMGCGNMNLDPYPNVFRVVVLERSQDTHPLWERDQVIEIACNIDDDTAEHLAWLSERLLQLGALDVWTTPFTGKKSRAGVCLSLLCHEDRFESLCDFILRKSTSFGVRTKKWDRRLLNRQTETRETNAGPVRYKIGRDRLGNFIKEKPEFDDVKHSWEKAP